jgi:hypothetical protein
VKATFLVIWFLFTEDRPNPSTDDADKAITSVAVENFMIAAQGGGAEKMMITNFG